MRNALIGIAALLLFGGGIFAYQQMEKSNTPPSISTPTTQTQPPQDQMSGSKTVTYTNSGYTPVSITIKAGETVIFVNESDSSVWTASALHPTHTIYPGSDIGKCGKEPEGAIFDSCKGYNKGTSWPFTLREKGTWKYHNHLNAGHVGTVVVE